MAIRKKIVLLEDLDIKGNFHSSKNVFIYEV